MLTALIGLALFQEQVDPETPVTPAIPAAVDFIELAGEQVAIAIPEPGAPLPLGMRSVLVSGYEYLFRADGSLHTRRRLEVPAEVPTAGAVKFPVKILVQSRVQLLERNELGQHTTRRMTLERFQITELKEAIGGFIALVRQASGGMIEIQPYFEIDDDLVFWSIDEDFERGTPLFGEDFFVTDIAPGINQQEFAAMDGRYRGPFGSVMVVHAGLFDGVTSVPSNPPTTFISFAGYGDAAPASGLANLFFESFAQHASKLAERSGYPGSAVKSFSTNYQVDEPRTYEFDYPEQFWSKLDLSSDVTQREVGSSFGLTPATSSSEQLFRLPAHDGLVPEGDSAVLAAGSATDRWVSWWAVPLLSSPRRTAGNLEAVSIGKQASGRYYVLVRAADGWASGSDADQLGVAVVLEPAVVDEPMVPYGVGPITFREEDGAHFVRDRGITRRGYVTIQRSATPLNTTGQVMSFEFQSITRDPYQIEFLGSSGQLLGSVPLVGPVLGLVDFGGPDRLSYLSAPSGEWTLLNIDTSAYGSVYEARIVVPAEERRRESRGMEAGYGFRNIRWGNFEATELVSRETAEPTVLALLNEPIGEEFYEMVLSGLSSVDSDVEMAALSALSRVSIPGSVPILEAKAGSASPTIAYLASRSLLRQGTPEAGESLGRILEIGPFDHNRRFAGEALMELGTEGYGQKYAALAASRSWRTRRIGVEGVFSDPSPQSTIFVMGLIDDPAAPVRLAISRLADANHSLANRRLLWLAVNDPSEQIRSETYIKLLDCGDAEIRSEALTGVRDESVVVQRAVLQHIAMNPNPEFRRAIQIAVIDRNPVVRALALDAFRAQPEDVDLGEIQNVLSDADPRVQMALIRLAIAKSLSLPTETVGMLNNSADPGVREEATKLRR